MPESELHERQFRVLAELSNDLVGFADIEGNTLYLNPAGCRLLKLSLEDALGTPIKNFHPSGKKGEEHQQAIHDVLERGVWEGDTLLLASDGTEISGYQTLFIHRDAQGAPLFVSTIIRDLREVRALEQQLQQARRLEAIGQLAGGVAHDFNNLLTVIINCVEGVREQLDVTSRSARQLAMAADASERAAGLCRQLLGFAQRQMIRPKPTDLNQVIISFSTLVGRIIGESIRLELDLHESVPLIQADVSQLDQILANLAVNARDSMPEGGLLVISTALCFTGDACLKECPELPEGQYVKLVVSDTGFGMSEEVKRRALEPFFTTKEPGKGTGLGLATVYGAVKQNGGAVALHSAPGEGTRIAIYWPCYYGEAHESEAPPASSTSTVLETGRILLVEDEPMVRKLTRQILQNVGYQVESACSPSRALEVMRGQPAPFDLVLTDVVMPDMNGPALVELLQKQQQQFQVIYMSGHTQEAIDAGGVLQKDVEFISKPYKRQHLLKVVRSAMKKSSRLD